MNTRLPIKKYYGILNYHHKHILEDSKNYTDSATIPE